jgi:hypothetical protein
MLLMILTIMAAPGVVENEFFLAQSGFCLIVETKKSRFLHFFNNFNSSHNNPTIAP